MKTLKLDPGFADYMGEAMKPLGVYLNFFQPTLEAGETGSFRVMMVNDLYEAETGELRLTVETEDGREVARAAGPFAIAPLGALSRDLELTAPSAPGRYLLKATAVTETGSRTVSRRKVTIERRVDGRRPGGENHRAMKYLTTLEVARELNVSKQTLLNWLYAKKVPEPPRNRIGYRLWSPARVSLIRQLIREGRLHRRTVVHREPIDEPGGGAGDRARGEPVPEGRRDPAPALRAGAEPRAPAPGAQAPGRDRGAAARRPRRLLTPRGCRA